LYITIIILSNPSYERGKTRIKSIEII